MRLRVGSARYEAVVWVNGQEVRIKKIKKTNKLVKIWEMRPRGPFMVHRSTMRPESSASNNTLFPQEQVLQVAKMCQATVSVHSIFALNFICATILLSVRNETNKQIRS